MNGPLGCGTWSNLHRLKDEATKLGFELTIALLRFLSLKGNRASFALQAPRAGAEKSHDFCYALAQHCHVAENVSFCSGGPENGADAYVVRALACRGAGDVR